MLCKPKSCRHLHIPLQSGDDNILMQMNRPYDSAQYLNIISNVRDKLPGVGITTDVIVGFPGEDEKAFHNTCNIIKEVNFSRLHVFRYSPRQRTKACKMPGQIGPETKKERSEALIALGIEAKKRFALGFMGKVLNVLVEVEDKRSNKLKGFADNYVEASLSGDNSLKGKIVPVKITNVNEDGGAEGIVINSSI